MPQIQLLSSKTLRQVKYCQIHKMQLTGKRIRTMKDNKVLV